MKIEDFFKGNVKDLGGFEDWCKQKKKPWDRKIDKTIETFVQKNPIKISTPPPTPFKIGDQVYDSQFHQWGEIVKSAPPDSCSYPIMVKFPDGFSITYTKDGRNLFNSPIILKKKPSNRDKPIKSVKRKNDEF